MIYVHLAEGFEEVEALTIVDVLRRAGIDAKTVSITGQKMVPGTHGVNIEADLIFEEADYDGCEMIVLPGGMPGAANLGKHAGLTGKIREFAKAESTARSSAAARSAAAGIEAPVTNGDSSVGRKLAAICAAPMVLAACGVLEGKQATIYPGMEDQLAGAKATGEAVTRDGDIITGKGPALAMEFALALVEAMCGAGVRNEVAAGLLFE